MSRLLRRVVLISNGARRCSTNPSTHRSQYLCLLIVLCSPLFRFLSSGSLFSGRGRHQGSRNSEETSAGTRDAGVAAVGPSGRSPIGTFGRTVFGGATRWKRTRRAPQAAGGFMCRRWAQTGEPDCPRSARMASYMQAACSLAVKQNGNLILDLNISTVIPHQSPK